MPRTRKTPTVKTVWVENPTPYELCQRYANGALAEDELIAKLAAYDYAPKIPGISHDNPLLIFVPSSEVELESAAYNGLIDGELYNRIVETIVSRRVIAVK